MERLQGNDQFQGASYGFAVTSIVAVVAVITVILLVWVVLFWYHLYSTIRYSRHVIEEREQRTSRRD